MSSDGSHFHMRCTTFSPLSKETQDPPAAE
jgi:hypothetical protein